MKEPIGCSSYHEALQRAISRRGLLLGAAAGLFAWASTPRTALAQVAIPSGAKRKDGALVVVFLRGGMDGLSAVAPYGEDEYYRLRPNLAIAQPSDRNASDFDRALDLDGFFGMHSSLGGMFDLYRQGELAVVHAVGSGDQTRSHFEAMSSMEGGMDGIERASQGGWLARYLAATSQESDSPLRALALSSVMPDSLSGATHAVNLARLSDYRLEGPAAFRAGLEAMYSSPSDPVAQAGSDTLRVLRKLEAIDVRNYRPNGAAAYPDSELGEGLKQVAALLRSDVGLEVAVLDRGAWDTHVAQGRGTGWLAGNFLDVAQSIRAFASDLGSEMKDVAMVVMTEFGRRAYENTGLGTDHGRASCMFVLGGGVRGGKVYGPWPGLAKDQLEEPGDLRVATDYRDVLSEVLRQRAEAPVADQVFFGRQPRLLGLFA